MKKLTQYRLRNLTAHAISYKLDENSEVVTVEPEKMIIRVEQIDTPVSEGLVTAEYGEPIGLPDPEEGTLYIVSSMVLNASSRNDLIAPNSGETAVKNEKGHVIYVRSFICKG